MPDTAVDTTVTPAPQIAPPAQPTSMFGDALAAHDRFVAQVGVLSQLNADKQALVNDSAARLGVDPSAFDETAIPYLMEERKRIEAQQSAAFTELYRDYPRFREWISRPSNAATAVDDFAMQKMAFRGAKDFVEMGKLVDDRYAPGFVEAFGQGSQAALRNVATIGTAAVALTGVPALRQLFFDTWDYNKKQEEAGAEFRYSLATSAAGSLGRMAVEVPMTAGAGALAAAKGVQTAVNVAAFTSFAQQTATAYVDFTKSNIEQGVKPQLTPTQLALGALIGATEAIFEKAAGAAGVGELAMLMPKGRAASAAKIVLGGGVKESIPEATQAILERLGTGETIYVSDVLEEGLIGGILGTGFATPAGISHAMNAKLQREIAIPAAQVIETAKAGQALATMHEALSQSKIVKREIAALEGATNAMLGPDQRIYINGQQWTDMWKAKGLDPADALVRYKGIVAGDNVTMPAGRFLAASVVDKDMWPSLLDAVKVSETSLNIGALSDTIKEIEKAAKEFTAEQEAEFADKLPDGKTIDDSAEIAEKINAEILAMTTPDGKKVDKAQAKHIATLQSQFYRQMAIELGKGGIVKTPKQVYEEYTVRFGSGRGDLAQSAYHGTGNSQPYDRFDYGKVGGQGGEGAQAYGWGLYFAGKKGVAAWYRDELTRKSGGYSHNRYTVDGKPAIFNPSTGMFRLDSGEVANFSRDDTSLLRLVANRNGEVTRGLKARLKNAEAELQQNKDLGYVGPYMEVKASEIEKLKELIGRVAKDDSTKGKLYTVDIPEDSEMLDWDKPLKEQPPAVKEAIRKIAAGLGTGWAMGSPEKALQISADTLRGNGQAFYKELAAIYARKQGPMAEKAASDALRAAGIPGLRYLDGTSRGAGAGSHNYVIFDDSRIRIDSLEQSTTAGDRGSYTIGTHTIELSTSKDKSTLVHESAHHFLTVMSEIAAKPDAPAYFAEQFASFRKWVDDNAEEVASSYNKRKGTSVTADEVKATPFNEQGRATNMHAWSAQHEYFARGFEQWVMDGKAPSKEVKSLFARFAQWIKDAYKAVLGLDVTLDDASRRMMARILATDEMIAAADAEAERRSMTYDALVAQGVDKDLAEKLSNTYAKYQDEKMGKMIERLAAGIRKEDEAKHQAYRDKLLGEILSGNLQGDDTLRAAAAKSMMKGEGVLPGEEENFVGRLNREGVKFIVGEGSYYKLLDAEGLLSDKGVAPEEVAANFLYSDAADFLSRLAVAKPMTAAIDDYITAREAVEMEPLLTKEASLKLAEEDAYGKDRAVVSMAMAQIVMDRGGAEKAAAAQTAKIDTQAIYHAQYPLALQMDPKNLNPTKWRRVANKFAKDSNKALSAGKMEEYADAKMKEAAAVVRADIEQEVKDSVTKSQKVIAKYADPKSKQRQELNAGDPAYVQAVDSLLGAYGFGQQGIPFPELVPMPVIPPGLALGPTPGMAVTAGQLMDLSDALTNIRDAQTKVGKLMALSKKKDRAEFDAELSKQVVETTTKETGKWVGTRETPNGTTQITGTKEDITKAFAAKGVPADAIVFTKERVPVDKVPSKDSIANYAGKFFRLSAKLSTYMQILDGGKPGPFTKIMDKLNAAATKMESIHRKYAAELTPEFSKVSASNRQIGDTQHKMSMENRVMFAAHWGSESGREKALATLRNYIPGPAESTLAARQRLADEILKSLDDKHLDLVEKLWRINNELMTETEAQHRRMGTIPPARIAESSFKVGNRTMLGGYMTARWVDKPHAWSLEEIMNGVPNMSMMPGNSYEKSRVKGVEGVLDLGLEVELAHIGEVARVLSFREIAADLTSIFKPGIGKTLGVIEQARGGAFAKDFFDSLSAAITGPPPPANLLDRTMGHLRRNATAAGLMFNAYSALSQFIGVTSTIAQLGPKATVEGVVQYLANPAEAHRFASKKSEFMKDRMGVMDANLHETYQMLGRMKALGKLGKVGMAPLGYAQRIVDTMTWVGAYRQAEAAYPGKGEAFLVARADQAVKDSQGSAQDVDLTAVHQSHVWRMLTLFGTPFTTMMNQLMVAQGTKDYKRVATTAMWAISATSIAYAVLEQLRGGGPEEDDYAKWFLKYHLETTLGLHPATRFLTPAIVEGRIPAFPGINAPLAGIRLMGNVKDMATGEGQDPAMQALRNFFKAIPMVGMFPSAEANRLLDAALIASQQGEAGKAALTAMFGTAPASRK